jgi:hypothetical protein
LERLSEKSLGGVWSVHFGGPTGPTTSTFAPLYRPGALGLRLSSVFRQSLGGVLQTRVLALSAVVGVGCGRPGPARQREAAIPPRRYPCDLSDEEWVLLESLLSGAEKRVYRQKKWTRGDSNPWPPPCEGGLRDTPLFVHVSKGGYLSQILEACVPSCSPTFAPVTVRVTVKWPRAASTMTSVSLRSYQTRRIMFGNLSYLGEYR